MSGLAVVMPNTRSAFYLKKEIKTLLKGKNAVLPAMFSMEEWVNYLADKPVVSELEARLHLFGSFLAKKNAVEKPETFFGLGQILLQDFEEIIRNQKPLHLIYRELSKWEETGAAFTDFLDEDQVKILERFWAQFDADAITDAKQKFISLWRSLPVVFEHFIQTLNGLGVLTPGMAMAFASDFSPESVRVKKFNKVWFAGFGHISVSEVQMMEKFSALGMAEIFWDVEEDFLARDHMEYSRLFKRLSKSAVLKESIEKSANGKGISGTQPETELLYCSGLAGMAAAIRQMVRGKGPETALIVTDPGLIEALLQAGYEDEFPYNMSMGYPLSFTTPCQWMSRVFSASEDDGGYRKLQLAEAVQHPFFLSLFPDHQPNIPACLQANPQSASAWISDFSVWWQGLDFDQIPNAEWQFACRLLTEVLQTLEKTISEFASYEWSYQAVFQCFSGLTQQKSLAIQGSGEKGIQVMGMYESRILDFEEVMIAPAGDGNLPAGSGRNSFLSESIRRAFGLPLLAHMADDEVYRFYRFFHRSRKITLFLDQAQSSGPGRIVQQLKFSPEFQAQVSQQVFDNFRTLPKSVSFPKNEWFFQKLNRYTLDSEEKKKSLSPSSLSSLFSCHLKFFLSRCMGLESPSEASEIEMDARDFGSWVHGCVQELYRTQTMKGNWLTQKDYDEMEERWQLVEHDVWDGMRKEAESKSLNDFMIEKEIGKAMGKNYFKFMAGAEPHKWQKNEYDLPQTIIEAAGKSWKIGGRADIMLETKDEFWLIDLKTGRFDEDGKYRLNPAEPVAFEKKVLEMKEVFQMLLYAWLESRQNNRKLVKAMLFHMANPKAKLIDPIGDADRDEVFRMLQEILSGQIAALADPGTEILQTEKVAHCTYCEFSGICRR